MPVEYHAIELTSASACLPRRELHGIEVRVHIGNAIATLYHRLAPLIALIPGGPSEFHIRERSLYPYLVEALRAFLPLPILIDTEATLHRLGQGGKPPATDISIRRLSDYGSPRLRGKSPSAFMEVKSVFHGESLSDSEIESDIEKLILCEHAYHASCFFVLLGLPADLARHAKRSSLGLTQEATFMAVPLHGYRNVNLECSIHFSRHELEIHVWRVSAAQWPGADDHHFVYSIFQHCPADREVSSRNQHAGRSQG